MPMPLTRRPASGVVAWPAGAGVGVTGGGNGLLAADIHHRAAHPLNRLDNRGFPQFRRAQAGGKEQAATQRDPHGPVIAPSGRGGTRGSIGHEMSVAGVRQRTRVASLAVYVRVMTTARNRRIRANALTPPIDRPVTIGILMTNATPRTECPVCRLLHHRIGNNVGAAVKHRVRTAVELPARRTNGRNNEGMAVQLPSQRKVIPHTECPVRRLLQYYVGAIQFGRRKVALQALQDQWS